MMLSEAAEAVGRAVLYYPDRPQLTIVAHGKKIFQTRPPEEGVIQSVSTVYVFVLYREDFQAKATRPEDLEFAHA